MDKRGISEVISAVLLILIAISAVAVLSGIIIPYVNNRLQSGTECQAYNVGYFQFEQFLDGQNYNCYKEDTSDPNIYKYGFSIKSQEADNSITSKVLGLNIILSNEVSSRSISINSSTSSARINELGSSSYTLLSSGETVTYVYTNPETAVYKKADVYAILKSGRTCELSDSISIDKCMPGVALDY